MRSGESKTMTNRAVLAIVRGSYSVRTADGGPGVYKEEGEEKGGIQFREKRVREGKAGWRNWGTKKQQIRR